MESPLEEANEQMPRQEREREREPSRRELLCPDSRQQESEHQEQRCVLPGGLEREPEDGELRLNSDQIRTLLWQASG
jgi:hypothetical protein